MLLTIKDEAKLGSWWVIWWTHQAKQTFHQKS